jgi:glycosyltransferase involved in cell wall biosynthesis
MRISVLICTRDRAASLRQTLASVFAQSLPADFDYEVVVVDNGSADETPRVVDEFRASHPHRLRYHFEGRRGLAHARNAGLRVVTGEVIAFTDDDVLVSDSWLGEMRREFEADAGMGVLAGRVLLARGELQRVAYQPREEPGVFDSAERAVEHACVVVGANMAFRREVFALCGSYDGRLGAGLFFSGCEDLDMVCRAMREGFRLRYSPEVLIYHNHDRLSLKQACRLQYGYGRGYAAYLVKHILGGDRHALRVAYWSAYNYVRQGLRRNAGPDNVAAFSRALLKGMVVASLPALWQMRGPSGVRRERHAERRLGEKMGGSRAAARGD